MASYFNTLKGKVTVFKKRKWYGPEGDNDLHELTVKDKNDMILQEDMEYGRRNEEGERLNEHGQPIT